jgi:hypothetical protein
MLMSSQARTGQINRLVSGISGEQTRAHAFLTGRYLAALLLGVEVVTLGVGLFQA